jgi:hypothetical protein
MLTSISLLMALLAVFLAVLGVIGWNAIVREARSRAETFLAEEFKAGSEFSQKFEKRAEDIVREYLRDNFKEGRTLATMVEREVEERAAAVFGSDSDIEREAQAEEQEDKA